MNLSYRLVLSAALLFPYSIRSNEEQKHAKNDETKIKAAGVFMLFGFIQYLYAYKHAYENFCLEAKKGRQIEKNLQEIEAFMERDKQQYNTTFFEKYYLENGDLYYSNPLKNPNYSSGYCPALSKPFWKKNINRFKKGTCPKDYPQKSTRNKFKKGNR